jgi:PEP-CTERM motif-containing protein
MRGKRWMVLLVVAMLAVFAGTGQAAIIWADQVIASSNITGNANNALSGPNGAYVTLNAGIWSGGLFTGHYINKGSITLGFPIDFHDTPYQLDALVVDANTSDFNLFSVQARRTSNQTFVDMFWFPTFTGGDIYFEINNNNFIREYDAIRLTWLGPSSALELDAVGVNGTAPVPEPGTMMLLGSGLVGLAGWGRKKFRK